MRGARWVIVDTETDGLRGAVHTLELCGQLMEGWEPAGKPFGMLLDHGVLIPPEAVAVHGCTKDFLRERGHDPRKVHRAFRDYAGGTARWWRTSITPLISISPKFLMETASKQAFPAGADKQAALLSFFLDKAGFTLGLGPGEGGAAPLFSPFEH